MGNIMVLFKFDLIYFQNLKLVLYMVILLMKNINPSVINLTNELIEFVKTWLYLT